MQNKTDRENEKLQILKQYFGYDAFREGQEEIIDHILDGEDVLAIMPTGAGKSLCYQVPALILRGITIVVSPLISLMMDQVKALNEAGVHAAYINSSLTENQIAKALEFAKQGRYKLIYVAPERLLTPRFLDFACHTEIDLLTVDEAHCISQWGQDFRPGYLKILEFINTLPRRPVVSAFTATATEKVKDDIGETLQLNHPFVKVTGFDRENLYFEVQTVRNKKQKTEEYVKKHAQESGIIYCATRKNVDELYLYLQNAGILVGRYHAGMSNEARKESQEAFIYDRIQVMVATNAFGMGIDKSNVRYVLHFNMPQSMENYYQEAGRAGRDGEPAECVIFYSAQDVMINQFLLDSKENTGEFTPEELRVIREQDIERLRKMSGYCTTMKCLRHYILEYFGQESDETCGNCSNCLTEFEQYDATEAAQDLLACIRESGQRYGMNLIIATLLGANTVKIRNSGMNLNSCYGKQSKTGQSLLKEIVYALLEQGYLRQTKDRYAILKLGDQNLPEQFFITYKKEEISENTGTGKSSSGRKKNGKGSAGTPGVLTEKSAALFEELRSLRYDLAKKRGIPPYMVASDRTLHELCVMLPFTEEEMLNVHGVGAKKYEQYGEAFLNCIQQNTQGDREGYGETGEMNENISHAIEKTHRKSEKNPLDEGPFGGPLE